MNQIKKVAVLGAGTMGAGIAGICADADCQVLLLDLDRSSCEAAKSKLVRGRSPVIRDEALLDNIRTGSFEDDLAKLAEYDWICEAVVENLEIKRAVFSQVESVRKEGSIFSTNTSGIPLREIERDMPRRLQQDIAVTHFFNPVHVMKLVELVPGQHTRPEVIEILAKFLGETLDKGVVHAKDTVNFIGNRIGCFWMLAGLQLAEKAISEDGLTIETVDALMSSPIGLPATGLYGLIDLIGLDVMYNVAKNLETNLPERDYGRQFLSFPDSIQKLHDRGQLGRKTGGGFYQLTRTDDGSKIMKVFDVKSEKWRPAEPVTLPENEQSLTGLFNADSANAGFVRELIFTTLYYAADLVPDIADDLVNVDRAMKWGFGWQNGPFEMIEQIGAQTLTELVRRRAIPLPGMLRVLLSAGESSFYRRDGKEYLSVQGNWQSTN